MRLLGESLTLKRKRALILAGVVLFCGRVGLTQEIQLGDAPAGQSAARRQYVELVTDAVQLRPGKPEWIELRFRVEPGMHINSHAPKDELLIPTAFNVSGAGEAKVVAQEYPAGIPLRLDIAGSDVLSTYQGEFRVRLQVVAPQGESALTGSLRYQACNARACFPPKSLPVRVTVASR